MIHKIALIFFLISVGVFLIWALPYTGIIAGISAIIAGVALGVER